MITVSDVRELRSHIDAWRRGGNVAFVPTMGNLHAGHLSLVQSARKVADRVVVSIFVNPLQFGVGEDFDNYPRTLESDQTMLQGEGADLLFSPTVKIMYPKPQSEQTRVEVPGISEVLCGASRPGHFIGVATVVCKLFNMVQPDIALFGKKDFQQLMVIRRMISDLAMPVKVVGVDTMREPDGLAMSSRNGYLDERERAIAPAFYRVLKEVADDLVHGSSDYSALVEMASQRLSAAGLRTDYLVVRRAEDLREPNENDTNLVMLGAAYLGRTRLIDNIEVTR